MRYKQILPLNEASPTPLFLVLPQAGKTATPWSLTKQKYYIPNCHGMKGLVDLQPKPDATGHWPFYSKEMILIDYATIIYPQPHVENHQEGLLGCAERCLLYVFCHLLSLTNDQEMKARRLSEILEVWRPDTGYRF